MMTRNECARWLLERDNYLILTHRRPDGDTLGSAAALCLGLRQLGKEAHILENVQTTERYRSLQERLTVSQALPEHTLVSVDTASPSLLPDNALPLLERISLRIDHHGTATPFTPLALVDPTASSCGDILYDVLLEMRATLDPAIAEALYIAVSTDTGCFRYANTNAHAYETAAACARAGGDLYAINQRIFDTNSLVKLRMQGWIAEHTRFFQNGTLAVCAIPKAVEKELLVTEDDMDSISGFTRSIEGVRLAATLRQLPEGKVKVSVRAVPGMDAAAVCAKFGGGGHKGAAGATLSMELQLAAEAIAKAMLETNGNEMQNSK